MVDFLRTVHPILAIFLIAAYAYLALQFFRKKSAPPSTLEITLAQTVRILLLFTYLTGLVMTMNFNLRVDNMHHYLSLLPVLVMLIFQFVPKFTDNLTIYAWLFLAMLISVLIISWGSGRTEIF